MEAGSIDPGGDTLIALAKELGKVAGGMEVLIGEVAGMRGELNGQNEQLRHGSERMAGIETEVKQLVTQVKVANGRTSKNEQATRMQGARIAVLERKWQMLSFFPRLMDRIAERPFWGAGLIAVVAAAIGAAAERFF